MNLEMLLISYERVTLWEKFIQMPRGSGSNLPGEKAKGLYFKQIQFIKNLDSGSVSACLRWSCLPLGSW